MYVKDIINFLKQPKIFVYAIIWMMILVVLGTLAQKDMGLYASQNRYFSAWITWFWFFPMPGGRITLIIILINLSFFFQIIDLSVQTINMVLSYINKIIDFVVGITHK